MRVRERKGRGVSRVREKDKGKVRRVWWKNGRVC